MGIEISNPLSYRRQKMPNRQNTTFGSQYILDVGASYAGGNVKCRCTTDDGKDLFVKKVHIKESTDGFDSKDEFTKGLANIVSSSSNDVKKAISKLGLSPEEQAKEEKISGLCILIPGQVLGKKALLMANLKTKDGKSLEKVYLSDVVKNLKENSEVQVSDDLNFVAAKDLAGTGRAIASKLANSPEYGHRFEKSEINNPDGDGKFKACAVMTGGGYGSVDIKVADDKNVIIETSESSHNLSIDKETKTIERIGKLGASKNSIIENFAEKMGYSSPRQIDFLCKTGNAMMVTQEKIKLDKENHSQAINIFTQYGDYNIVDDDGKEVTLELNSSDPNTLKTFKDARKYAVEEYADAIAQSAIPKVNAGFNLMILTGPMAIGLDKTIKENQGEFEQPSLSDMVMSKLDSYIGHDYTCKKLMEAHNFKVVCDNEFNIPDNTEGGEEFLKDKKGTYNNMDELITVPIKELKKSN